MKKTLGTLGFGLAGAVAAVGLMSAGVPPANAQIVLTTNSPAETVGSVSGTYDFTYYLQFGDSDTVLTSSGAYPASVSLTLNGTDSEVSSTPTLTVTDSGILSAGGSFVGVSGNSTADGATYIWNYNGGSYTSGVRGEVIGYITVVSNTPKASAPSVKPNYSSTAENGGNSLGDYSQNSSYVPDDNGTPLAPLPLPAAFWPGLLTLASMAVVGGLRLRRRIV